MKIIQKSKMPRLYMMEIGFACFLDGAVILFTLGNYCSSFQLRRALKYSCSKQEQTSPS